MAEMEKIIFPHILVPWAWPAWCFYTSKTTRWQWTGLEFRGEDGREKRSSTVRSRKQKAHIAASSRKLLRKPMGGEYTGAYISSCLWTVRLNYSVSDFLV